MLKTMTGSMSGTLKGNANIFGLDNSSKGNSSEKYEGFNDLDEDDDDREFEHEEEEPVE
jgi:hypothetical protein